MVRNALTCKVGKGKYAWQNMKNLTNYISIRRRSVTSGNNRGRY
jgi:hypothetical protein